MRRVFYDWNGQSALPETFCLSRLLPFSVGERLILQLLSKDTPREAVVVTVTKKSRAGTFVTREVSHDEREDCSMTISDTSALTATFSAPDALSAEAGDLLKKGGGWIEVDRAPEPGAGQILIRLCLEKMETARVAVLGMAVAVNEVGGRLRVLVRVTDRASRLALARVSAS